MASDVMKKLFILFLLIPILNVKGEVRENYLTDVKMFINDTLTSKLTDNNYSTYITLNKEEVIKITSEEEFNYVYIIYYRDSMTGTLTYNTNKLNVGRNSFLHECLKLDNKTTVAELSYEEDVRIKEIFLFDTTLPSWVQTWEVPYQEADIVLFSTHSDDEHLFFAGLIPTMIANDKKIQVVYLTQHNDNPQRLDEQLNGLWAVGMRNYPVLGVIPDAYSTSLDGAINNLTNQGFSSDDATNFIYDIIKRFKPKVVVGHDEAGEYGHGQHMLNTYALKNALNLLREEEKPYKVYLHLYQENPIMMNYDIPLEYYNGLTAFAVSKLGYAEHKSQHYTWFTDWLLGKNAEYTLATDIKTYSPLEYGLYYSKVGYENKDGDMFYNIPVEIKDNEDNNQNADNLRDTPIITDDDKEKNYNYLYYIAAGTIFLIVIVVIILKVKKKH